MNLKNTVAKMIFLWISRVHLGRLNMWPFCRKCRELVLTSGRITWRKCCFISILLNNVWSASSAKSRNENNCMGAQTIFKCSRLRKELIRPICSTVRNPLQAGNACDLGKYYGPKTVLSTWHTLITEKLK